MSPTGNKMVNLEGAKVSWSAALQTAIMLTKNTEIVRTRKGSLRRRRASVEHQRIGVRDRSGMLIARSTNAKTERSIYSENIPGCNRRESGDERAARMMR
jgi:hypothetical protein